MWNWQDFTFSRQLPECGSGVKMLVRGKPSCKRIGVIVCLADAKEVSNILMYRAFKQLWYRLVVPPNALRLQGHFRRYAIEHWQRQQFVVIKDVLLMRVP